MAGCTWNLISLSIGYREKQMTVLKLNLMPEQILVLQNQGVIIQHSEMPICVLEFHAADH